MSGKSIRTSKGDIYLTVCTYNMNVAKEIINETK